MSKNLSPVMKSPVAVQDTSYQIILTFNENRELIDVAYPQDFDIATANSHVVIAALFLSQQLLDPKTK